MFQNSEDADEFRRRRCHAARAGDRDPRLGRPRRLPRALASGRRRRPRRRARGSRDRRPRRDGLAGHSAQGRARARHGRPTPSGAPIRPSASFSSVHADTESMDALCAAELDELRGALDPGVGPTRGCAGDPAGSADLFVFPSFYQGGHPTRAARGGDLAYTALVAADVPGSHGVVEDGVNGFPSAARGGAGCGGYAAALLRLAGAPELRRRLGARSRARAVSRFDLAVVAESTEALYRSLLAADQGGG